MKYTFFSIALSFLLFLSGCGEDIKPTATLPQQFTNDEFSINYPANWEVETQKRVGSPDTVAVILSEKNPKKVFSSNINVTTESVPFDATSLEYAEANIDIAPNRISGFSLTGSGSVSISGEKTLLIGFEAIDESSSARLKFYQSFLTKKGKGYVITGATQIGSPKTENLLKEVILSWKLN